MAPNVWGRNKRNHSEHRIVYRIVHTGQYYERKRSEVFFNELEIPRPESSLEVWSNAHATQ